MSTVLEPFEFAFFRNGLMVATVAGALCGLVGVYVTLRGMSYIGHGLSHAIFGGAAASAVVSFNFFAGAGLWGLASALLIGRVSRRRGIGSDAAIGVITSASFAFGLALVNRFGSARRSVESSLFGSILGVSTTDVWAVLAVAVVAALFVFLCYRALLFTTFDPDVAAVSGVGVGRLDAVLMAVLAASILVSMKVLGVVLIAAILVIPPVIARMLTDRFSALLWLSTAIGATCGFVGMNLSYHLDVSSGATIVLVAAFAFAAVFAVTGPRGLRRTRGLTATAAPVGAPGG